MTSLTLSPLIRKDLLTLLRTQKAFWLLWICVLISGLVLIQVYGSASHTAFSGQRSLIGQQLFYSCSQMLLILLGLSSAVIPSISITSERENRTLDLLTATGMSRLGIVLGKWFSALAYQFVLLIAMLPAMAAVLQLGGVGRDEYLCVALLITMTVCTYSLLGLAVSAWMRRSASSLVLTLCLILCLNILLQMLFRFLAFLLDSSYGPRIFHAALPFISPIWTLMAGLTGGLVTRGMGIPPAATSFEMLMWHHGLFQLALATASLWMAWLGVSKGRALTTQTAKKPIDDQAVLEVRRRQFPFYLVDPLRRPQQIADNQNPLYIKEIRSGAVSRLNVLIRIGYVVVFGSFLLLGLVLNARDFEDVAHFMFYAMGLVAFFVPILAASSVGKEFEEQTIDLLSTTPLGEFPIILAKYRVALRFILFLFIAALLLPFMWGLIFRYNNYGALDFLHHFVIILAELTAFLALYTALGIYCSALCRRTLVAILLHYFLLAGLLILPSAGIEWAYHQSYADDPSLLVLRAVATLINPFCDLLPREFDASHPDLKGPVWPLLVHIPLLLLLTYGILKLAARSLRLRLRRA